MTGRSEAEDCRGMLTWSKERSEPVLAKGSRIGTETRRMNATHWFISARRG